MKEKIVTQNNNYGLLKTVETITKHRVKEVSYENYPYFHETGNKKTIYTKHKVRFYIIHPDGVKVKMRYTFQLHKAFQFFKMVSNNNCQHKGVTI